MTRTRTLACIGRTKHTKQEVAVAIRATNGLLTHTARALGCSYRSVQNYMNRWPDLRDIVYEAKEKTLDISEDRLFAGIRKGNPNLIMFHLKTQAKQRGYVERTEDDLSRPIQVAIVLPQDFPKNPGHVLVPSPPLVSEPYGAEGRSIGHDNLWDVDKDTIRESTRGELGPQEPNEDKSGISVRLGESGLDISAENPNAGDVRAFLKYKAQEIWSHSQAKVRKLSDVPMPYELEVIS